MTPQVSYMKALDLWVLICILFVFSTLVEYGFILYLTSRSAWQKRVDAYVRSHSGHAVLKTLNPVKLISITLANDWEKEPMPEGYTMEV
jgi:hypothetical protein